MVFAPVQFINLLAETGLAQLNTHEDKQPTRDMPGGGTEWMKWNMAGAEDLFQGPCKQC